MDKEESIQSFSESGASANRSAILIKKHVQNQMDVEAVEYPPFELKFRRQVPFEDDYGSEIANRDVNMTQNESLFSS